jgi:putative ABC transport system ATP-binding protein
MTVNVFSAQGLTETYISGEVTVQTLRGLDLEVRAGEVVALPGPSDAPGTYLLAQ